MNWNSYFEYKDGKLYWKVNKGTAKVGEEAGYINEDTGYIDVGFDYKRYQAHRIIWEMHYGSIPEGMEIDHIWHNKLDNRIENLRLVTPIENSRNKSKHKNNISGVTGVSWNKRDNKWNVYIGVNGKNKYLGSFSDFNQAVDIRKQAELKYQFHENHGK